jgi:hypothetical protein
MYALIPRTTEILNTERALHPSSISPNNENFKIKTQLTFMLILTRNKRFSKVFIKTKIMMIEIEEETSRIKECGSVSMESVVDTITRVFLGISLLGMTFSILSGTVNNVRQIVDALFVFIRGSLSFIPGINDIYFK